MTGDIVFDQVWKKFRKGERHNTLRDLLPATISRLVRRRAPAPDIRDFWALRDVSFRVKPGHALGIIGANGAGKSTVLKLLTRILRPTTGRTHVVGRVGALIELAAGFHPDLTGRENIFVQGALMGMPRARILEQFDAIVDFAGIAAFLETPVKRYSSGMNARLGFAIALHLDPDALIVDEVLSVGDFRFQQRAFSGIDALVHRNIPVVMVSHQLDRIASLCSHGLLLDQGKVVVSGSPSECISRYLTGWQGHEDREAGITVRGISGHEAEPGGVLSFVVEVATDEAFAGNVHLGIRVRDLKDWEVTYGTSTERLEMPLPKALRYELELNLTMNAPSGQYVLEVFLADQTTRAEVLRSAPVHLTVSGLMRFYGRADLKGSMVVRDRTSPRAAGQLC